MVLERINAKLIQIRQETHDVKTFRFWPDKKINFIPGQFFLMFANIGGQEVKRSYSIASSPTEGDHLDFTIKIYPDGQMSQYLNKFRVGSSVELLGPYGAFTLKDDLSNVVLLCAGTGVAPMRSMAKYILDKEMPVDITLIYSVKTPEDIIYRKELNELANNSNFRYVQTITRPTGFSWEGLTGRIDTNLIRKSVPDIRNSMYYICGPPEMVKGMVSILKGDLKIPDSQIKLEAWE